MSQDKSNSKIPGVRAAIYIFLAAALAGVIVCVIGILIGAAVLRGEFAGFGVIAGGIMGGVIGFPVGVITGIILMHRFFHYNGSLWFGILGSIVGVALVIGLSELFNLNENTDIVFICFLLVPPMLGTAGYCLGRKKPIRIELT